MYDAILLPWTMTMYSFMVTVTRWIRGRDRRVHRGYNREEAVHRRRHPSIYLLLSATNVTVGTVALSCPGEIICVGDLTGTALMKKP